MLKILAAAAVTGVAYQGVRYMKNASMKLGPNQHVVIVGGGYGGIRLAKELKGKGNFTIIDPKDAFHHNMASLRAAVVPGFSNKTFIPYKPSFGDNFVQGRVKDIDLVNKNVILDNNEAVNFTELVLATGTSGPFPGKLDHTSATTGGDTSRLARMYEDMVDEIRSADDVIIVGGGAVGVEMSGEISDEFPDKNITIIHGGDQIVSSVLEQKARDVIMEKLKERNVKVIFNEKVANLGEVPINKTVKEGIRIVTKNGREVTSQLVIPCYGSSVNNQAYSQALGESMNEKGQLKVDEHLQVVGQNGVFAIGDCNDVPVTKLALEAQLQGSKTFRNLVHIGAGQKLEVYKPDTFRMVVPIGRNGGVCQNGTKVMGDFLAKMIKAKDVFVKIMWKEMSQPVPADKN